MGSCQTSSLYNVTYNSAHRRFWGNLFIVPQCADEVNYHSTLELDVESFICPLTPYSSVTPQVCANRGNLVFIILLLLHNLLLLFSHTVCLLLLLVLNDLLAPTVVKLALDHMTPAIRLDILSAWIESPLFWES